MFRVLIVPFIIISTTVFGLGNQTNYSFNKSKKILREIYKDHQQTFYCGCDYNEKLVNYKSCSYSPKNPNSNRSKRIEWEHIVPAYDFGRSFVEWREGHKDCVNNKGKKFKGRNCARKISKKFRLMESDMYNLVPAIGEINAFRSNHPITEVPDTKQRLKGNCKTVFSGNALKPRDEIKGFVARVYKYMNDAYPGHGIISKKNLKLFDAWDKQFSPTAWEIERAKRIEKIQKNGNKFITAKNS
ncbi:MAG: endonuclease [Oligoflexales bacterium]